LSRQRRKFCFFPLLFARTKKYPDIKYLNKRNVQRRIGLTGLLAVLAIFWQKARTNTTTMADANYYNEGNVSYPCASWAPAVGFTGCVFAVVFASEFLFQKMSRYGREKPVVAKEQTSHTTLATMMRFQGRK
jgi:hypothetical protein